MIAFNFEKQKALEVLDYFKKYYDLDENAHKELDKNFAEYSKLYETNPTNNTAAEPFEHQELDKSQVTDTTIPLHNNNESFITQKDSSVIESSVNNICDNINSNNSIKDCDYVKNINNEKFENTSATSDIYKEKDCDKKEIETVQEYEKIEVALQAGNDEIKDKIDL